MLSLTDERPGASSRRRKPIALTGPADDEGLGFPVPQILDLARQAVGQGLHLYGQVLRTSLGLLSQPTRALDYLRDGTGVAGELGTRTILLMPMDSPTRFKGKPSGDKRVAWDRSNPLEVKAVSHALDCSSKRHVALLRGRVAP